jgi:TP901 family phage tail tape measure protein
MALNNMGLGFTFTTRDLASAKLDQLSRRFQNLDARVGLGSQRMGSAFQKLQAGAAAFAATAGALGGVWSLATAAGQFEQKLAAVGAVTRATAQEMQMLREAAIDAGLKTQFSPQEAVEGLTSLATAGQTARQATQTLLPVLDLAAGSLGQLGVAKAAEAVVGTLNAYGMAADQAAGVTDKLLRITQLTNFQTRDFEGGLAKAAASGAVFKQSLDDALITMGLLRNRNIDASSSATAYREAVRRVGAESRAQKAVIGAGVDIFDKSTGEMRSIVDVMVDFADATKSMTDEERNRRVAVAFGARGLLAFNAILNASFTTTKDGAEITYKGAEAIAQLRAQMNQTSGTAADFRDKMLDTFEGQKTLLIGTLQTFAVALGEPLIQVLKPVVMWLVKGIGGLLRVFDALPDPVKRIGAVVVLLGAGFVTLVAGVASALAAFMALKGMFAGVGAAFALIKGAALPVIAVIGLIIATVAAFKIAFDRDLGGIATLAQDVWRKLSLAFQGIKQLFEGGAFSGAVREELNRAGNEGLKRFVINTYRFVYRLGQIWEGLRAGFDEAVSAMRPVFEDLSAAARDLFDELGQSFDGLGQSLGDLPVDRFRGAGRVIADVLAVGVRWVVKLSAVLTRLAGGVVAGFRAMMTYLGPALQTIGGAIQELIGAWKTLVGVNQDATQTTDASTASWKELGRFLGTTFGAVLSAVAVGIAGVIRVAAFAVHVVHALKEGFVIAGQWIAQTAASIWTWFTETLPNGIRHSLRQIAGFLDAIGDFLTSIGKWFVNLFARIGQGIVSFLKPIVDFFQGIARAITEVLNYIKDLAIRIVREIPDALLPESLERVKRMPLSTERPDPQALTMSVAAHLPETSTMPAAEEAALQQQSMASLEARLQALAAPTKSLHPAPQPIVVQVQVDGETIAEATQEGRRDLAARRYAPLPTY